MNFDSNNISDNVCTIIKEYFIEIYKQVLCYQLLSSNHVNSKNIIFNLIEEKKQLN